MKRMLLFCALMLAGAAATTALAERVECRTIADNWVDSPPWDPHTRASANHGSEPAISRLRPEQFRAARLRYVSRARECASRRHVLRVRREPDPTPLTVVGISTISGSGPWSESEMNYFFARQGQPWSYAGSDLADVVFGLGGSLYTYIKARDAGDGWYEIDVPAANRDGSSHRRSVRPHADRRKGRRRARGHAISSRDSADPPVLIVEGTRATLGCPAVCALSRHDPAEALGRTSLRPGSVILRFAAAPESFITICASSRVADHGEEF